MLQLGTCNFQFVSCIRHKNLNPLSANFQFPDGLKSHFKAKLLIPHGGIKKKLQQTTDIKSNFDITKNKQSSCRTFQIPNKGEQKVTDNQFC